MAASPNYKVYSPAGEYEASCKHVESAAALVAFLGDGATIRYLHKRTVWTEGKEAQPAAESYDYVVDHVYARLTKGPTA